MKPNIDPVSACKKYFQCFSYSETEQDNKKSKINDRPLKRQKTIKSNIDPVAAAKNIFAVSSKQNKITKNQRLMIVLQNDKRQ